MSETSIRPATVSDAVDCSAVLCESIRFLCVPDHQNDEHVLSRWLSNKTPETMAQWIQAPGTEILVAERNGAIVSVGGLLKRGEIMLNYVRPETRFTGVSRELLAFMEAALKGAGITEASLTSTETAHRFYLAAGWVDAGEPKAWGGLTAYPMTKSL